MLTKQQLDRMKELEKKFDANGGFGSSADIIEYKEMYFKLHPNEFSAGLYNNVEKD